MQMPLLALEGLTKAYPGVIANESVSFEIKRGEIHALLGENGAGKSTLVKMIYGLVRPDSGEMTWDGQPFFPADPREARNTGVAMVFQHFSLFEALSVAENVALGMEQPPAMTHLSARITDVSQAYGLPLDPDRLVGDLSAGERQRVEIVRCLLQEPRLLIMDEPTSVLTPQEVETLFATLRKLKAEGTSVLYISHKLDEIRTLCDHATVLRGGKNVATCTPAQESARSMAEMMVGRSLATPKRAACRIGDPLLEVRDLSLPSLNPFGTSLKSVNLTIKRGEVLGIGGVAGNGQDELLSVLSGETLTDPGAIVLQGENIGRFGINARRELGLLAAPEERLGHAAAPDMTLIENAFLTAQIREELGQNGLINWRATRDFALKVIDAFDVRTPGPENAARSLSGGNLQKFVVGREILQNPGVLVINQPTWGVDAAAAASIRQALLDLAEQGAGIILISQDLDELREIATSFTALFEGRLSHEHSMTTLSLEDMGLLLGGAEVNHAAA